MTTVDRIQTQLQQHPITHIHAHRTYMHASRIRNRCRTLTPLLSCAVLPAFEIAWRTTSPPSTRTVYRSRLDRGVTTSLPATFFEGLLIRKAHPLYALYGTFSFILSYSGSFLPLCLCDLSISCVRTPYLQSHSVFLFILGERTGSFLGIIFLYISDFYISIFSHPSYS